MLIAGDAVWLPPALQRRLRRFVARGGTLATVGVDSLQRQARLTPGLRLVEPTPRASTDLWGSRVTPPQAGAFDLVGLDDALGLFAGTGGRFPGFHAAEVTTSPGPAKLASSAVTRRRPHGDGGPQGRARDRHPLRPAGVRLAAARRRRDPGS